jgi:hypothetical protein
MAVVGGRVYSLSENLQVPILIHKFDPTPVWDRLVSDREGKDEEQIEREIKDLDDRCFWSFLSPDESLLCFFATEDYIAVFDVESRELRWCHRLKGHSANDYWQSKPVFHPTKPMIAWIEQFGKDCRDDFSSLKHCGVYICDTSSQDNLPLRLEEFTGKAFELSPL